MSRKFTHRPTGYNTDPKRDRCVNYGDICLGRLIKSGGKDGLWQFHYQRDVKNTPKGYISAPSLDLALEVIKDIYIASLCRRLHGNELHQWLDSVTTHITPLNSE